MPTPATLTKVAECLYRNAHGTYFALLKVRGKQIKKSLKTTESAVAKRLLAEERKKAHGLAVCHFDLVTPVFEQSASRNSTQDGGKARAAGASRC